MNPLATPPRTELLRPLPTTCDRRRLLGRPPGAEPRPDPAREAWVERLGWIDNFPRGPRAEADREFADSEVYKMARGDGLGAGGDALTTRSTPGRQIGPPGAGGRRLPQHAVRPPGPASTWSDLEWGHELYCLGHLIQAAVARRAHTCVADDGLVGSHAAPPITCASVSPSRGASAVTPRSRWPSPSSSVRRASRATSSRRGCSSSAAAGRTLRDIE